MCHKKLNFRQKSFRELVNLLVTLVICIAVIPAQLPVQSQETPSTKKNDDDIIRVNSNLVNVDVIVKDKKGKVVRDLKAEDFVVTENGLKQSIEYFDATLVTGTATETASTSPGATELPASPSSLPRNVVALVLDGQTTEATNLKPVREGIIHYINNRITTNDSVALFAIAGGLQLLQPFTQDKKKLISAVETLTNISAQSKTAEQRDINASIDKLRDQLTNIQTDVITSTAAGSAAAQAMISRRVLEEVCSFPGDPSG